MEGDSSSIGVTLIALLKTQLEGDIQFANNNGTTFRLEFEKADVKGIGSSIIENV
jgi:two-component sensor histidine kinase